MNSLLIVGLGLRNQTKATPHCISLLHLRRGRRSLRSSRGTGPADPPSLLRCHGGRHHLPLRFPQLLTLPPHCPPVPAPLRLRLPVAPLPVFNGRGDRKTEKGKRFNHSYGDAKPRDKKKGRGGAAGADEEGKYDDGEIVKIGIDECLFS